MLGQMVAASVTDCQLVVTLRRLVTVNLPSRVVFECNRDGIVKSAQRNVLSDMCPRI